MPARRPNACALANHVSMKQTPWVLFLGSQAFCSSTASTKPKMITMLRSFPNFINSGILQHSYPPRHVKEAAFQESTPGPHCLARLAHGGLGPNADCSGSVNPTYLPPSWRERRSGLLEWHPIRAAFFLPLITLLPWCGAGQVPEPPLAGGRGTQLAAARAFYSLPLPTGAGWKGVTPRKLRPPYHPLPS